MLTVFEVRRRIDTIREAPVGPFQKARMLLRLRKRLGTQVRSLRSIMAGVQKSGDRQTTAVLSRLATSTEVLDDDICEAAQRLLRRARRAA